MGERRRYPTVARCDPRWRASVAAALVGVALAGCSATDDPAGGGTSDDDRPVVLTTFTVLADIARNVAGDHLRVESITPVGAEIHGYEPTPSDLRRAADAQLVLDNGLGLEAWFEQFVADLDVPHVVVSDGVDPLPITEDAAAGTDNPHAWMSPVDAQAYAANIADAFADLDPDNAQAYADNAEAYGAELDALHTEMIEALDVVPDDQRVLVTCEGAFSYLARDAGLDEVFIWPVNAEREATPTRIARTIERVRSDDVPAVFCESTVSDAAMRQVVEETDADFGGTLYVDSLSEADGPVPTYLELMRHTTSTIVDGLTGSAP